MPVEGLKIRIAVQGGHGAGKAWRRVCKVLFGIDGERADRFFAALPRAVTLSGAGAASRERVAALLAKEGITAEILPDVPRGSPCQSHRRVLALEECPSCGERRACVLCLWAEVPPQCADCAARSRFWTRFKWVRVAVLLAILAVAAWTTYGTKWRLQNWAKPLTVAVYPMIADPDEGVPEWAASVGEREFEPVAAFLDREGHRFGVDHVDLVKLRVAAAFSGEPPPEQPDGNSSKLDIALWSLKLRAWSFRTKRKYGLPSGDVEIFVLYHRPSSERSLDRSLAVEKLRTGVVHALAGRENVSWTALALGHEFLHTVGATDKYLPDGMPSFPEGYADPNRTPRFPQRKCEVMAGEIAVDASHFRQAQSLDECLVGEATAREIGWHK